METINTNRGEKILVVDDAPDTLEVLRRNLSSAGFQVYIASSVPEAIRGPARIGIEGICG